MKKNAREHHARAPKGGKGPDKALLEHPTLEGHGTALYPTDVTLETIKRWPADTHEAQRKLMAFVKLAWWAADWGWNEHIAYTLKTGTNQMRHYEISTGGWSGNEDIIQALKANYIFWSLCWLQSRRGGHYVFEIAVEDRAS